MPGQACAVAQKSGTMLALNANSSDKTSFAHSYNHTYKPRLFRLRCVLTDFVTKENANDWGYREIHERH
jgi:hypothetical protein